MGLLRFEVKHLRILFSDLALGRDAVVEHVVQFNERGHHLTVDDFQSHQGILNVPGLLLDAPLPLTSPLLLIRWEPGYEVLDDFLAVLLEPFRVVGRHLFHFVER